MHHPSSPPSGAGSEIGSIRGQSPNSSLCLPLRYCRPSKEYVEVASIPTRFGGKLEYEHGSVVSIDAAINDVLEWEPSAEGTLPLGPMKWV